MNGEPLRRLGAVATAALVGVFAFAGSAVAQEQTDTTVPTLTGPSSVTVSATWDCDPTFCATVNVPSLLTASDPDNSASELTISCNSANGTTYGWGETMVTCEAYDPAGNHSAPFYINVFVTVPPPTFQNVPGPISTPATSAMGAVVTFVPPTATDVGGESVPVTCDHLSGITYPIATTTVTCTAKLTRTDPQGNTINVNSATTQFTITVTPEGSSAGGGGSGGGGSGGGGTGGGGSGSGTGAGGGSTASDTTAPTIEQHPNIRVDASGPRGATVAYRITVTDPDNGTAQISSTCQPASGSRFALGAHATTTVMTVTCHAQDPAGNEAKATSFAVTVLGARDQLLGLERAVAGNRQLLARGRGTLVSMLVRASRSIRAGSERKGGLGAERLHRRGGTTSRALAPHDGELDRRRRAHRRCARLVAVNERRAPTGHRCDRSGALPMSLSRNDSDIRAKGCSPIHPTE